MKTKYIFYLTIVVCILSCKKYLDHKPDNKLVVPSTINDLQGLLDNFDYMNNICSEAAEVAADNYYLPDDVFFALSDERNRSAYLWQKDIFLGSSPNDWQNEYTIVYNANVVLENIEKIERNLSNQDAWDNCKGSALVFRAKSFYEIAQIWTNAYDSNTAHTDLGIPLKLSSDFNTNSVRANLGATYNQIIDDLKKAIPLLPKKPIHTYRPSQAAAYGLLARTYLTIGNYVEAYLNANLCLEINSSLLDYNNINPDIPYAFGDIQFNNPEDIMHSVCSGANYRNLRTNRARIDSLLYNYYDTNDLRKVLFFASNGDGTFYFQGNYDGASTFNYNGLATDEVYLIRSESSARLGNIATAMNDLNSLLIKRYKNDGTFTPFTANNVIEALNYILFERRKELIFRMLRWTDIKRLNKKGANISLTRIIQGQAYIIPPNDSRYALPIPDNVVQLSDIQQNPGY